MQISTVSILFFLNSADIFSSVESSLKHSVSLSSIDSDLSSKKLAQKEAFHICSNRVWSSFLCVLGLSSVIEQPIHTFYPDFGMEKFRKLYNAEIKQRIPTKDNDF